MAAFMKRSFRALALRLRHSLRAKVALGVALPTFLLLSSLSVGHYLRERSILEYQMQMAAAQLGDLALGGLRYAMLTNDRELVAQTLRDMGRRENVERVRIIDLNRRVRADSRDEDLGLVYQLSDAGCTECHRLPPEERPRTLQTATAGGTLRVAVPIPNEPQCAECHGGQPSHLGMVLLDVSLVDIRQHIIGDLRMDLAVSTLGTVVVTVGIYLLLHWLVVRRAEAYRGPLARLAAGDLSARLPVESDPQDELGELAVAFNQMADSLARQARAQMERSELRQRAIVEERERIARELHDGMAQLLGYVNTKAMAIRLLLHNHNLEAAQEHLQQLEQAARELFVEVREAILGLRLAAQTGEGLAPSLETYVAQFSRLCSLPVEIAFQPEASDLRLPAESELQLLRIVQEALTNVRKHAAAKGAWVSLQVVDGTLELVVGDDGVGFLPGEERANGRPHFGLTTMRERAEAIGASFEIDSEPDAGTRVIVRLPLEEA